MRCLFERKRVWLWLSLPSDSHDALLLAREQGNPTLNEVSRKNIAFIFQNRRFRRFGVDKPVDLERVIVFLNVSNVHWVLVLVDFVRKWIVVFDSLYEPGMSPSVTEQSWLRDDVPVLVQRVRMHVSSRGGCFQAGMPSHPWLEAAP